MHVLGYLLVAGGDFEGGGGDHLEWHGSHAHGHGCAFLGHVGYVGVPLEYDVFLGEGLGLRGGELLFFCCLGLGLGGGVAYAGAEGGELESWYLGGGVDFMGLGGMVAGGGVCLGVALCLLWGLWLWLGLCLPQAEDGF